MTYSWQFLLNLWIIFLEASTWLLLGLIVAGFIKIFLPTRLINRWLGGGGVRPVLNAAIIGTPLPLCSCSVIPAAIALRRGGASRASTVSFLIATPENGADSIAISYALLGPVMTVIRPIAAIITAVGAGILTTIFGGKSANSPVATAEFHNNGHCCAEHEPAPSAKFGILLRNFKKAFGFAFLDLFADIAWWLAIGLVLAAAIRTIVSPGAMAQWASGLPAMVAILVVGIPMYICATASTPVAAAMLLAGVSPGTVLVFLLAGPATNLGTVGIVRRELGARALASYLIGISIGSIGLGLLTDWALSCWQIDVLAQMSQPHTMIPHWLAMSSSLLVGSLFLWTAVRRLFC